MARDTGDLIDPGAAQADSIDYETAFMDYLAALAIPYVPANEIGHSVFRGARLKSFDFLVYPRGDRRWIVDIKGRRFPYGSARSKRYWENWVTQGDLDGLAEWQAVFGPEFEARLVFAYFLEGPPERWPVAIPHRFEGGDYAFLSVRLDDYQQHCQVRSPKWQTVTVPRETFRQIARPLDAGLAPAGR